MQKDTLFKHSSSMSAVADPAVLRVHVQQLHVLTSRIEEFLSYQIHRLESVDRIASENISSPQDLDRLIDEFEQLRRNWELERQQETERLRDNAEKLQEAWRKLEREQRQLLTRQAAMRTIGPTSNSMSSPVATAAAAAGGLYPAARPGGPRAVNSVSQQYGADLSGTAPSHKAQIQFQQLRREMQKHAQQRNKR